jgi:broad specificity phosphatase PhoE
MKWPHTVTFIRHGESAYNVLKRIKKDEGSAFGAFEKRFLPEYEAATDENWVSPALLALATEARKELIDTFSKGDYLTPLTEEGMRQAEETGKHLLEHVVLPDVIYVSPYLRTRQTLEGLIRGCPELGKVRVVVEERVREQEHGLSTVYNDWRIYMVFNPIQALLYRRGGNYEYRFLNGENKADVRDRVRSFLGTLIRENQEENVLIVSHHLTLLAFRANLERWDREEFVRVDREETPINCGVTTYYGDASQGREGRLVMKEYNKKLYQ